MGDPQTRLFVYGTLLAASQHPLSLRLRQAGERIGEGSIQGCLYVITETDAVGVNRYPGAIPSANPGDRVFGEVWKILDREIFTQFDAYEACSDSWPEPHEFLLRRVPVAMTSGEELWAVSYLYTWDLRDAERIVSGRFSEAMPDAR